MNDWKTDPFKKLKFKIFDIIVDYFDDLSDVHASKISLKNLSDAIDEMFEKLLRAKE